MDSYDEDLSANPFFVALQQQGKDLYEIIATNRWMVCVPRVGTIENAEFTEEDFLNHVLIPAEGKNYNTLSNKELSIQGSCISTGMGFSETRAVLILFEETYFNEKDESYQVLCINQTLEGGPPQAISLTDLAPSPIVHSLQDCANLLWNGEESSRTKKSLDDVVALFNRTCSRLESESLRNIVDAANALFTRGMQIALRDLRLRKSLKKNPGLMEHIKLAMETYVLHGVYRKLFKNITTTTSTKDSRLNKITRNLAEIQLRDLGIRQEFCYNVPWARRELSNLRRYSTPLGKLNCIRRVVQRLQKPHRNSKSDESGPPLTTDDLLPILVFLVVKSDMPNWWAHFVFMTNFRFAKASNDDEYGFYLATLEAALEHVGSGQLNSLELGAENPQRMLLSISPGAESLWQRQDSSDTQTSLLFQYIRDGDLASVEKILNKKPKRPELSDIQAELCHPLCSCPKCFDKIAQLEADHSATVYSRDDRGYTALHVASVQGNPEIADFLLKHEAVVNATDYHGHAPLHVACQKGQQAVSLLLLHCHGDMNLQDNDGNTPLHLASANGHEDCVKALVYYDHDNTQLDLNTKNDSGNTALHLAARWGYEIIVQILWENGASVKLKNRKKQTPLDCAHNIKVARILDQASEDRERLIRRRDSEIALKMTRSASLHGIPASPISDRTFNTHNAASNTIPRFSSSKSSGQHAKKKDPVSLEHERKVEKLLKAVADGDIQMVRFHLGWTEEDLHEEDMQGTDIDRTLCHPLCQCDKCQPIQQLSISPTGIYVNSTNAEGLTPLHVAAMHAHPPLVELFCQRGANVNARDKSQDVTPIHLACQNNRRYTKEVVKILLENGAMVNLADCRGNTALHFCCLNHNKSAASVLIKYGACVSQANLKRNAPLHEAAKWNSVNLTKLLIQHGAKVNDRNRKQQTPIHLAQNDKVLKLLIEASSERNTRTASEPDSSSALTSRIPRSSSVDSHFRSSSPALPTPEPLWGPETVSSGNRMVTVRELMSALSEKDLQALHDIAGAIQTFDRRHSLKQTITRDRSAPRLDNLLACQLSIQHFDPKSLRRAQTIEHRHPVVVMETIGNDGALADGDESGRDAEGRPEHDQRAGKLERVKSAKPDDRCDCEGDQMSGASGAASMTDVHTLLAGSSTSSEESDIFIREKDYVKYIEIEPMKPTPPSTDASGCTDVNTPRSPSPTPQHKPDPHVTGIGSSNRSPPNDPTCSPIHQTLSLSQVISKKLAGQITEDSASCGSDAEADVFFKDRPADPSPYLGISDRAEESDKGLVVSKGNDLMVGGVLSSSRGSVGAKMLQTTTPTGKVTPNTDIKCDVALDATDKWS